MSMLNHLEIEAMPTLAVGQAADLKIDTGTLRVWMSRCRVSDGETQPVQVERLINGRWEEVMPEPGRSEDVWLDGDFSGLYVHVITRMFAR